MVECKCDLCGKSEREVKRINTYEYRLDKECGKPWKYCNDEYDMIDICDECENELKKRIKKCFSY